MKTTPRQYVIDAGWGYESIESTAKLGVADEDIRILSATDCTPKMLLDYCVEQVAIRDAGATE